MFAVITTPIIFAVVVVQFDHANCVKLDRWAQQQQQSDQNGNKPIIGRDQEYPIDRDHHNNPIIHPPPMVALDDIDENNEDLVDMGTCRAEQDPTIVQTLHGALRGFTDTDSSNATLMNVFLGIPFALAPVGPLRFEKPRPIVSWSGLLEARSQKSGCVPHARPDWLGELLYSSSNFSEDCLYLNIFSPHGSSKRIQNGEELFPVLVLIHGGAFLVGSSHQFGDHKGIGTKFVSNGIIVVSIQYRIGVLGFASSGDAFLPGNLGLWDLVAALQFIRQNIKRFGGDPEEITLMGHSAGASSVSALSASPHSRLLFKRSVQMSGSGYSSLMYGAQVPGLTIELAETIGCTSPIKECLRRKPIEELFAAVEKMGPARARFGPRIDGDFFPRQIPTLVEGSPRKPTLIGFTDLEALFFTLLYDQNSTINSLALPWAETDNFGKEQFEDFIRNNVAKQDRFGARAGHVQREIFDFYTKSSAAQAYASNVFYIRQYTQLISDLVFNMAILNEIQHKSVLGWPVFMYVHSYVNEQSFPAQVPIHESFNGNDFGFLFNGKQRQLTANNEDFQMEEFMAEAVRNFVKKSDPSTSNSFKVHWPRVFCAQKLEHIRILRPPIVQSKLEEDLAKRMLFWQKMAIKYPEYDLIREIPLASTLEKQ